MKHLFLIQTVLVWVVFTFCSTESGLTKVVPVSYKSSRVFLLLEGEKYSLNFTLAREACLSLNVTMATRAQMEEALQHGLEVCKFGWIAERIGVVPRLKSDENCGRGKTGVVAWKAAEDRKFGVFCFNSSAVSLEDNLDPTTASVYSSTSSLTPETQTATPSFSSVGSTKSASSTGKLTMTKSSEQTSSVPLVQTTLFSRISSSVSPRYTAVSLHHVITSKPSEVQWSSNTTSQTFGSGFLLTSAGSGKPPKQGKSTVFTVAGIVLLLLMGAGAAWFYQLRTSYWCQAQQDDLETEMWKQTTSETKLRDKAEKERDAENMDSCCDTSLCMNTDCNTNSEQ